MNSSYKSDKYYWHKYINFYESFFNNKTFKNIAEIGVFKGESIRWLLERFPESSIYGADILPVQSEWPINDRFIFMQLDQGNIEQLQTFFSLQKFDLIIEDGSHNPIHQALALIEGIKSLNDNGIYILEDIHTSHHSYIRKKLSIKDDQLIPGNALTTLLAIDHFINTQGYVNQTNAEIISRNNIFSVDAVKFIADNIKSINLYKRTSLPDYCYNCKSSIYDFSSMKCSCGVDLFSDTDSMSFVIQKK